MFRPVCRCGFPGGSESEQAFRLFLDTEDNLPRQHTMYLLFSSAFSAEYCGNSHARHHPITHYR